MPQKRTEEFYEGDRNVVLSGEGKGEPMQDVLARRWSRRRLVGAGLASGIILTTGTSAIAQDESSEASPVSESPELFKPIELDDGDDIVVAEGHSAVPFLRWGDPITADAPEWDINNQTREGQEKQVGYNCDWIGFFPLPQGSGSSDRGLLTINHEYTNPELMFHDYLIDNPEYDEDKAEEDDDYDLSEIIVNTSQDIVDVEMAAHGMTIIEVRRDQDGEWTPVVGSELNRRITATTPMEITGPAAGADWMKTSDDPEGVRVVGMLNNCAGGQTPWGTVLTCEENFHQYFANRGEIDAEGTIRSIHSRYGMPERASERLWEEYYPRFDMTIEPHEPFRYGWVVEIDPYDPTWTPRKRTALGRVKHEGATSALSRSGQVAFYCGDDSNFEYAYKFVTSGSYDPDDRAANFDLLDNGTLYVARFNDDGSGLWLPLVYGQPGLTDEDGFTSQADVLIRTRQAADAVGATKMDRPEDFETNPVTGKVYLVCTNNTRRDWDETDRANPRPNNFGGHIIEIIETNGDHSATSFIWDIFILAGDPDDSGTWYSGHDDGISPFAAPDNLTFDLDGNIWISTDGLGRSLDGRDGLFMAPTEGEERGLSRQFFSSVPGAEVSGPIFNSDNTALWLSVQHPGSGSTIDDPSTLWPDGKDTPRPTVVLVTNNDRGKRVGQR